jgi:hypothetical protein
MLTSDMKMTQTQLTSNSSLPALLHHQFRHTKSPSSRSVSQVFSHLSLAT